MDDTPLSFRDNYQPHNTGSPLSFVGWCRVGQRGRSGSESAAVGGGSGFGYLDYLRSVFLSFLFFFFPYYLHVERSRRRRIHPPYSPITSRRFVGRCLSHAHIRRNVDHAPGKIPCREGERERGEKTKSATHTHITNTLRIMYMPLYIPNIIPMSIRPCCSLYASVSPCHPSQLNSTQLNPPTSTPQPHLAPYSVLPPNTPPARPSKAPTISSTIPPATRPTATPSAAFANRYRIVRVTSDHPSSRPGAGDTVHRVTRLSKMPFPLPVGGREEGAGYPHSNSVAGGIVVVAAPETASTIPPAGGPGEGMEYTSEV